jgi:hypothetical protein
LEVLDEVPALERSTLTPPDLALAMAKHHGNRLGFAVLLAFFRSRGRFPRTAAEIDPLLVEEIAQQLAIVVPPGFVPSPAGRTAERHRAEIRALAGFREAAVADAEQLEDWLRDHVAAAKLELIREIGLPADLFDGVLPHELERYRRRVAVEAPYDLRRHPEPARLTWLAAFGYLHARTLTDDLVDLLIETIHHIGARAERRVDRELLDDLKRVSGKHNLLFDLAGAVLEQPDGIVRDVVFPVVSEQTLRDLVREAKATGSYRTTLRTVIRNSYKGHYRRMVPEILQRLQFRSNNAHHRPIIQALDLLKRYAGTRLQTFPAEEVVPIDGIVPGLWREAVVEKDAKGHQRINRITYEICVLEALRDKLRCKEVWVVGANRYRNPDEDLPADFEAQRTPYYEALKLPLDADRFIADLQAEMREALQILDTGLPRNRRVRIGRKRGKDAWITVTPFDPQPEAPNLTAVKAETVATWPMTSLLDILKETDIRLNFTDILKSTTVYETLDRSVLRPRLLLCLNGLGTNAGFQRMAGLQSGTTAKDLAYVRRRYITTETLRQAIAIVTNGTLHARNPAIWGEVDPENETVG